jgi:hypothetical protein
MSGAHPPRQKFQYRESVHTRQLTRRIERETLGSVPRYWMMLRLLL